eukprot:3640990-Pleurochrysis_carterae.AAC.8
MTIPPPGLQTRFRGRSGGRSLRDRRQRQLQGPLRPSGGREERPGALGHAHVGLLASGPGSLEEFLERVPAATSPRT